MSSKNVPTQNMSLENVLSTAITIPGVKVNRRQFLAEAFAKENVVIQDVLDLGPVEAGCSREMLKKMASSLILNRTSYSSLASFAAGLPGGFAMAVSIPADVLQFFGMTLRLAQELTYLYGGKDLWEDGQVDSAAVKNELVMYCGVMFGVTGASAGVRLLSAQIAKTTMKKLPQKALTKTMWYPIVKQIGKAIGIRVTKNSVAKGISKAIPVVGGVISGGLNFASMLPMGNRLAQTLDDATFDYTEDEIIADYNEITAIADEELDDTSESKIKNESFVDSFSSGIRHIGIEIGDVFSKKKKTETDGKTSVQEITEQSDPLEVLTKLAKLKEAGIITEDDFETKKQDILSKL